MKKLAVFLAIISLVASLFVPAEVHAACSKVLLETGDAILLESGDFMLTEASVGACSTGMSDVMRIWLLDQF